MARPFGIAGVQMSVIAWDAEATVEKMADAVLQIRRSFPWVQLVLFHEMAAPGLVQFVSSGDADWWKKSAQPVPGPLTERLCEIAVKNKVWLVPGSIYEKENEKIYNTALAISPEGKIAARYRKIFPWLPYESDIAPGNEFCVFDVPEAGRFGLCICYDMWFPEVARTLAWMGAEVILHPTMTPTSDRVQELCLSQANAIFNQCYFIDINGVGPYGGGSSLIVDPNGRILQQAGSQETILTEVIDLELVRRTRETGTLGLSQLLKQWRDTDLNSPLYAPGWKDGPLFQSLSELKWQRKIDL